MKDLFNPNLDTENPSQLSEKEVFTLVANQIMAQYLSSFFAGKTSEADILKKIKEAYNLIIKSSEDID